MTTEESVVVGKSIDLDAVLARFGIFDRYHGLLMLLLAIGNASNCVYTTYYIFATEETNFRCNDSDVFVRDNNCSQTCTEWIYENPDTFVAEYDLACQSWKRGLVGTIHSFGNMVGLLIVGPLSDRLGRKTAMVITGVMGGVVGLARSFAPWYWLFIALEFLEAIIGDISSPLFMLSIEIVATKKRVPFSSMVCLGYPLGGMITPFIAWLFPYWRTFIRVIYAPGLLFIFYAYLTDESPRWLLAKHRNEEAKTVILKAAKRNKVKIEKCELENLSQVTDEGVDFLDSLKNTLQSKILLKRFCVCVVWWITCTFVNFGLSINSVSLPGNKYLNFAILWFTEIPAVLILIFMLKYMNKKSLLTWSFCLCGLMCVIQPFIPTKIPWLSFTLYMTGKLMATIFLNVTCIFTSELFPTCTRNSMHALCSALGRIGSIVAPQTPLLLVYWAGLPSFIFGSLSLVAGLLTFLVPDTSNNCLPDTVKQAEALEVHKLEDKYVQSNIDSVL